MCMRKITIRFHLLNYSDWQSQVQFQYMENSHWNENVGKPPRVKNGYGSNSS